MDKESCCKLCWIGRGFLQRRKRVSTGLSISPCSRWYLWPRSKLQIWHGCLFWMEYHGWSNCSWRYRSRRLRPFIQMGLWTNSSSLECLFKHQDFLIAWKYKLDNKISIWIEKFLEMNKQKYDKPAKINYFQNGGKHFLEWKTNNLMGDFSKWPFSYQITVFLFFQH